MNLRDLQYLTAVADLKNFTAAAEHCHVSQPSLSGQIKKLEDQLGIKIFERSNKKVMVTDIGSSIIRSARLMLDEYDRMKNIALKVQDPFGGSFRLGAFPTISSYLFPKIVPRIISHFKDIKLILIEEKTEELIEKLISGKLDAAILALPIENRAFHTKFLFDDPFYLAVPKGHSLSSVKAINQDRLNGQKLLLLEDGHCLRDQALDVCQLNHIAEEPDFRATSLETLRLMVQSGGGITFMPEIAVRKGDKDIKYIPFEKPAPKRSIGLVWRKTTTKPELMEQIAQLIIKDKR